MNLPDSPRAEALSHWTSPGGSETHWAELVELYEYKVGDLLAGRNPRGGKRSLGDLRDLLMNAPLEGALLRRFGHTDRTWKKQLRSGLAALPTDPGQAEASVWGTLTPSEPLLAHLSAQSTAQATAQTNAQATAQSTAQSTAPSTAQNTTHPTTQAALSPGQAPSRGHLPEPAPALNNPMINEQGSLEGLRFVVWREEVRAQARTQTQQWLREPDLVTLRCAYAMSVNLERGETSMSVPRPGDPLASLGTPSVAERVISALADQICAAFIEPPMHQPGARQQALIRLRQAVTQLSLNPFPRHPDQDVMKSRVEAAEREGLSPDLTRTLIEGLQAEVGAPRGAGEHLSIKAAARRLAAFLEDVIPVSEGGHGPEMPPLPRALYAATPRFQLAAPDDGSSTLVIRLSGNSQVHWRGLALRWKRAGEGWLVAIGPLEYRLTSRAQPRQPDLEAAAITVTLGDVSGRAMLHGDYLHLAAKPNDKGLLELLALSRAVSLLLDPSGAYLNLRLARAAAQRFRDGRIDELSVNVLSAERYAAASPDALMAFARKGVEGLLTRMRQRPGQETEHVFEAAADAIEADDLRQKELLVYLRRVLTPETRQDTDPGSTPRYVTELGHMRVAAAGELVMLEFAGEPLTIEVMGRSVTLRLDYKGDLAVILPGAPAAILRELLVIEVAAGGILLVRQGGRIVISYQPHIRV